MSCQIKVIMFSSENSFYVQAEERILEISKYFTTKLNLLHALVVLPKRSLMLQGNSVKGTALEKKSH